MDVPSNRRTVSAPSGAGGTAIAREQCTIERLFIRVSPPNWGFNIQRGCALNTKLIARVLTHLSAPLLATVVAAQTQAITPANLVAHDAAQEGVVDVATGAGVKIGVIGPPVDQARLDRLVVLGLLPTVTPAFEETDTVTALDGIDTQGTSLRTLYTLQSIHKMAPGAQLFIASPPAAAAASGCSNSDEQPVYDGPLTTNEPIECAIRVMEAQGVDIIVDIVGPVPSERAFYPDAFSRYVESVAENTLYVVAAGDEGNLTVGDAIVSPSVYEHAFTMVDLPAELPTTIPADGESPEVPGFADTYGWIEKAHSLTGADTPDPLIDIPVALSELCLTWADDPSNPTHDYDLFVFTRDLEGKLKMPDQVATAFQYDDESADQKPRECVTDVPAFAQIMIGTDKFTAEPRFLRLEATPKVELAGVAQQARIQVGTNAVKLLQTTTDGSITGRAGLPGVITVGSAAPQNDDGGVRAFEAADPASRMTRVGPRRRFYDYDATTDSYNPVQPTNLNAEAGALRITKPDVAGVDYFILYWVDAPSTSEEPLRVEPLNVAGSDVSAGQIAGLLGITLEGQPMIGSASRAWSKADIFDALLGTAADESAANKPIDIGPSGIDVVSGYGAPLYSGFSTSYQRLAANPQPVQGIAMSLGAGSGSLTWRASSDDSGLFVYLAACVVHAPGTQPSFTDVPFTTVTSDSDDYAYEFLVSPGNTATCKVEVALNSETDARDVNEAQSVTDTASDLAAPVFDPATDVITDIESFTVTYTVGIADSLAAEAYSGSNLVCTLADTTPVDLPLTAPDPVTADELAIGSYDCTLNLLAFGDAVDSLTSTGSKQFTFQVTPDEQSTGLPIWLLYEATKQPVEEPPVTEPPPA